MPHTKMITASVLALALGAGLSGFASAQSQTEAGNAAELQAVQNAKLSVADAAKGAEAETGGKAMDVAFDDENGQLAYEVEVALNDGTTKEVLIDAQSGKVLKVSDHREEQNGEQDDSGEPNEGDND